MIHNFFRYQKISGKKKGSFTKLSVSVMWDKKFPQNRDAPLLCMKIFDKEFFWNTEVFSNEIFWYSETKTSTENRDTPTFLCINFFATGIFLKHSTEGFPYEIFRHWDSQFLTENLDTPSPPPHTHPLIQTFSIPEINERLKGSPFPYSIFRHCETKNFRRKMLILAPSYP